MRSKFSRITVDNERTCINQQQLLCD